MPMQEYDLLSSEVKRNPLPTFARMRQSGPLVRVKLPLIGPAWLATTYEAVSRMLRDQETYVRDPTNAGKRYMARFQRWMPRRFVALASNMLGRDEPDHRRLRSLVEQAFLRHSVEGMRGRVQTLADEFLDELAIQAARHDDVDLIEHFARPFPLAVICEMLGLPSEDRPRFIRWGRRLTTMSSAFGLLKAFPGIWKLHNYLRRQFQICRKEPRAGLMSALVEAEEEGDKLNEEELLAMTFLLLLAGHETTVHLISSGVFALLESPEEKAKLLADWSKVAAAVEEVLRYMSPAEFTKPRLASKDVELYGQRLARGEYVLGMLAAANHDPDQFEHPERFDIDRDPNPHLSFGTGIHVCLGLKLARVEAQIALQSLFTRYPNLEPSIPCRETQWSRRLGIRALAALPVRLGQ